MKKDKTLEQADVELQKLKTQIAESRTKRQKRQAKRLTANKLTDTLMGAVTAMLILLGVSNGSWLVWGVVVFFTAVNILIARADLKLSMMIYNNEQDLTHMEGALLYSADMIHEASKSKREVKGKK